MASYWMRHRLFISLIVVVLVAIMSSVLFMYPYVEQKSRVYNSQSVYNNSNIDFIVPEPSFGQVEEIEGTHGINKVFPYFLTKTGVNLNGKTRTTVVLLSDQFQNIDMTMYNSRRLIRIADEKYENPAYADWEFVNDTGASIGDYVSVTLGERVLEYRIYAIYETNSLYDGGALLVPMTEEIKVAISEKSKNNGYSGMYVSASDYGACRIYLMTDYRPLGRLKTRDQFETEDQYSVHYDAIMSSGFANEITDFRVRKDNSEKSVSVMTVWIGAAISAIMLIIFNCLMSRRGCEHNYFVKHCIPKGQKVGVYYVISFIFETIMSVFIYGVALFVKIQSANFYIPMSSLDVAIIFIPAGIVVIEFVCIVLNLSGTRKESKV